MLTENIIVCATNCLYGGVIGDALGGRYEFNSGLFQSDMAIASTGLLPILGGGVWSLAPGQVTDDSEMAMALAGSIILANYIDAGTIAGYYREWYDSHPFDIGKATKNALKCQTSEAMNMAAKAYDNMCLAEFGSPNLSNGMLMRIAPIAITMAGIYSSGRVSDDHFCELVRVFVEEDTILTHASEEALCYASAYTLLLCYAILDGNMKRGIKLIHTQYKKYHNVGDWYTIFCNGLDPDARLAHSPTEKIGDVRIAFQLAIRKGWLVSTRLMTYKEAIISTVKLGGDTDTNACIVGYLCGAMTGLGAEDIPSSWKKTCVECDAPRYKQHSPNQYIKDLKGLAIKLLTIGKALGSQK